MKIEKQLELEREFIRFLEEKINNNFQDDTFTFWLLEFKKMKGL